ncbi:hypothetical protein EUTSA_v10012196mg [Eutrema salsugineum]|uniref:DC1 domain-containing protein n=1 Tax=Eutrema salsugineum TaxID=72664 RepID=V4KM11_EUTSA|nr:uncharacterized protein LOC18010724 [Eutrema salsugineum]ESQ30962.1 hypothetical protein EUTSA_v10012196mg [Eutrema salsugineum]
MNEGVYGCNCLLSSTSAPRLSEKIVHPCHPSHPLMLLLDGPPIYSNGKCNLCQQKVNIVYHCSLCDFSLDVQCAKKRPQLTVNASKCHEHTLSLLVGPISFTCNACGTCGDASPYVCTPCFLTFHRDCINRPHVININRHEHRIAHTNSLVFGNWICEICQKEVNWRHGSYTCKICPSYAVHSRCATRKDVWNGRELEGVPEEVLDIKPFEVIKVGVINHFSHKHHNLRLIEDAIITNGGESIRCEACTRVIYSGKHYSCMKCNFVLHEKCANFPRRKRHGLFIKPLSLHTEKPNLGYFRCDACWRVTNGFVYICPDRSGLLDVLCATLSRFTDLHCHPHSLFLTTLDKGTCGACKESNNSVLHCVECKFTLDFWCATLPKRKKHKCDDHFLFLRNGQYESSGTYWCEICETIIDSVEWFYTCEDCGVVCHIDCVVGEFANIKPGIVATNDDV